MASYSRVFCVGVGVCIAFIAYVLQSYSGDTEKEEVLLGVCVLSARDHYEHRAAIRETWFVTDDDYGDEGSRSNRTVIKFVVGMEACPVHPHDRVDQYGCQEWTPNILPDMKRDFEAFTVEEDPRTGPIVTLLSIRVMHPITLKRIGILESLPLSEESLVVSVYVDFEEEELCSANFSEKDPGIVYKGYRYQPVAPVLLPKVGTHVVLSVRMMKKMGIDHASVFPSCV